MIDIRDLQEQPPPQASLNNNAIDSLVSLLQQQMRTQQEQMQITDAISEPTGTDATPAQTSAGTNGPFYYDAQQRT